MKIIDSKLLTELNHKAFNSQRKRTNFNLHPSYDDKVQRMINVLQPGTYIRPHKHSNPPKNELFAIIQGKLLVCCFNERGDLQEYIILDRETGNYLVEIEPEVYHTIIALSHNTSVLEVKEGPYVPISDKDFASWAPTEGSPEAMDFIRETIKKVGVLFPDLF